MQERDQIGKKAAVIGAGISGLTAGRELKNRGFEVTLFEKSRGAGGRASTRRDGDYRFDHGAQYFTARDERFIRQVEAWMKKGVVDSWKGRIVALRDGRIMADKGTIERYVGVPGMNAISRDLADGLKVQYDTRIERITAEEKGKRKKEKRVMVANVNGVTYGPYNAVIVTVPPAQALPLLDDVPGLAQRVADIYLEPCWAVMAVFEENTGIDYDGAFVHGSPLSWVARNSSKPERPETETWILHASPEWSREHLEDSPESVAETLLASFTAHNGRKNVNPVYLKAHRWRYSIAKNPLSEGSLKNAEDGVIVAGDWCHESRIEGAYLSGLHAADRIMGENGWSKV